MSNKSESEEQREKRRQQVLKGIHFNGLGWFIGIAWGLFILIVLAVAWHYITPIAWHFLVPWQLDALQGFLFSSAVVGFGVSYLRRQID